MNGCKRSVCTWPIRMPVIAWAMNCVRWCCAITYCAAITCATGNTAGWRIDRAGLGGLWADQALGVLGVYPLLRGLLIRVPPLRRVTFYKRLKSNQKRLLLRTARSLGLGVPSLRDRSGRSAYGLLRCTSSRCVWLRQTVAALPRPDQSLHSAFRRRPTDQELQPS
ncbi:exported hypothetical protein [Pseudomonas zeae]